MPRPKNLIPSVKLTTALPLDAYTQLTTHLFSPLENRVPHNAYATFLADRIREFFSSRPLDLSPYNGTNPGTFSVRGSPESIAELRRLLGDSA